MTSPSDPAQHRTAEPTVPITRMAGLAAVLSTGAPAASTRDPATTSGTAFEILSHFTGPYGDRYVDGRIEQLEWALILPGGDEPLSTWSVYGGRRRLCLIEGEFYDVVEGAPAGRDHDPGLARRVYDAYRARGPASLRELNGVFCGLIYRPEEDVLTFFCDRLGVRSLFWMEIDGRIGISANLYGLRGFVDRHRPDALGIGQLLTLGYPVGDRTLFDGVRLLPPGRAGIVRAGRIGYEPYFEWPRRRVGQSLRRSVVSLCGVMDDHVRRIRDRVPRYALALSSGRDSRAILRAMMSCGRPEGAVTWFQSPRELDARVARQLAAVADVPFVPAELPARGLPELVPDAALLGQGESPGTGALQLGMTARRIAPAVFSGFSGDMFSGRFHGVVPWASHTPRELALKTLGAEMRTFAPAAARRLLAAELRASFSDIRAEWIRSFEDAYGRHPVDLFFDHRVAHHNRRRSLLRLDMARVFCTPIYPYADVKVIDAFLELPTGHLIGQKAHTVAAYAGVPGFARLTAYRYGTPLWLEPSDRILPFVALQLRRLAAARAALAGLRRKRGRKPPMPGCGDGPGARVARLAEPAIDLEIFDPDELARQLDRVRAGPRPAREQGYVLAALAIAYRVMTGIDSGKVPRPVYLSHARRKLTRVELPETCVHM